MSESDFKSDLWIAKSIGDLLAAAPRLKGSPLREHLRANLSACIESVTFGNLLCVRGHHANLAWRAAGLGFGLHIARKSALFYGCATRSECL